MNKEKLFVIITIAAVIALIIWKTGPNDTAMEPAIYDPNVSTVPTKKNTSTGLQYLLYNQPYYFGPPVQNVTPYLTSGQVGQDTLEKSNQDWLLYGNS